MTDLAEICSDSPDKSLDILRAVLAERLACSRSVAGEELAQMEAAEALVKIRSTQKVLVAFRDGYIETRYAMPSHVDY